MGCHTPVIADCNAAFQPNPQVRIRYTQAGATFEEGTLKEVPLGDSLDRWTAQRQINSTDSNAQIWDCPSRSSRAQS